MQHRKIIIQEAHAMCRKLRHFTYFTPSSGNRTVPPLLGIWWTFCQVL